MNEGVSTLQGKTGRGVRLSNQTLYFAYDTSLFKMGLRIKNSFNWLKENETSVITHLYHTKGQN